MSKDKLLKYFFVFFRIAYWYFYLLLERFIKLKPFFLISDKSCEDWNSFLGSLYSPFLLLHGEKFLFIEMQEMHPPSLKKKK